MAIFENKPIIPLFESFNLVPLACKPYLGVNLKGKSSSDIVLELYKLISTQSIHLERKKIEKDAEANLKKIISFKGAQIPQFEANVLKEIEILTKEKFTKVDKFEWNKQTGFIAENNRVSGIGIYNCGLTTLPGATRSCAIECGT